jgi:F0F1-type ATP synthase assembly protein I
MVEPGGAGKTDREQENKQRARDLRGAAIALTIGYSIVAPIIGGPILGWFLDQQFGTTPWLFIILMIGGIYGGLSMAIRLAGKI